MPSFILIKGSGDKAEFPCGRGFGQGITVRANPKKNTILFSFLHSKYGCIESFKISHKKEGGFVNSKIVNFTDRIIPVHEDSTSR